MILALLTLIVLSPQFSALGPQESAHRDKSARPAEEPSTDAEFDRAVRQLWRTRRLPAEATPDPELEKAILHAIPDYKPTNDENSAVYFYSRVDLNRDGTDEVIVYLIGGSVCASGGCPLLIYQTSRHGYRLKSDVGLVPPFWPIVVSNRRTRGWNDLVVYVRGGGIIPGHFVALRFNGRAYPDNPTIQPAIKSKISGRIFMPEGIHSGSGGTLLKP
jgi:hypothetical protein